MSETAKFKMSESAITYGVYPDSVQSGSSGENTFMASKDGKDFIIAQEGAEFTEGIPIAENMMAAPLSHENACVLRKMFPFTAPKRVFSNPRTICLGDRLGMASLAHLRSAQSYDYTPVLVSHSMKAYKNTGRTFEEALDCITFAVFREGYASGFGAEADHVSSIDEIRTAIAAGYSMIVLDCGEHIRSDIDDMTDEQVINAYVPEARYEKEFLGHEFDVGSEKIVFDEMSYKRMMLMFGRVIAFICNMYFELIARNSLDYEVVLDTMKRALSPSEHFFLSHALYSRGVELQSFAPRFFWDYGIAMDYTGDMGKFENDLKIHASIAEHFGYKLSIHNGSYKMSLYTSISKLTSGKFHLKAAGTSYVEGIRLIAMKKPALYREIHEFARMKYLDAGKEFPLTADISRIPELDTLSDDVLPGVLDVEEARQLIQITYDFVMNERNGEGRYLFRNRLLGVLEKYQDEYTDLLSDKDGRMLRLLCRRG